MLEIITGFVVGFAVAVVMFASYLTKLDKKRAEGELFVVDGRGYRAIEIEENHNA